MKPLTAAERIAEHTGDLSYLTGTSAVSRLGALPPLRASSRLTGAMPVDASPAPPDAESTNRRTSGFEPGHRSLTVEQYAESDRIQQMVFAHRARVAERERLAALAEAELLT